MDWNKNNNKALIGTLLFHALLVVALVFLALRTPLPLPGEQGVEVRFGTDEQGMGTKPKAAISKPQKVTPPPPEKKVVQTKPVEKKVITQSTEEAPALPKKQPEKENKPKEVKKPKVQPVKKAPVKTPVKKEVKKVVKKPQPVVNQRALFKMNKTQTGESSGLQPGMGNPGKPHGITESNKTEGKGGVGNGISYNLGGRGSAYLDKPSANFTEQGTVVVKIWVDPSGNVIRAQVYAKGTTVVNEQLRNMALEAAKNSKFVADPTAPAQQTGTITYTFILKK
ncbi:MAG: TonB family protein [Bacteroidales bacterium]|nr:TonB family protein [Bacteroidales bacterium]